MEFWTITQLNSYVKNIVEKSDCLKSISIKGEISNFTNHAKTGHFYFTLKDSKASIKAIMFSNFAKKVPFKIESGMKVIVTGSIKVFERDGIFQVYCEKMEPDGIGAFYLAFEQRKKKLQDLGYFDPAHKKKLPRLPKKIAVITAKTGAVIQDIKNILSRRYPLATLILVPSLVQGESAIKSICDGIDKAEQIEDIDVIIVARGGGSIEDLWCFNSEVVATRIYNCTVPIISAVGHETDFTLCDFVADVRGATPSEAAELVAPDIKQLDTYIKKLRSDLDDKAKLILMNKNNKLNSCQVALKNNSPKSKIEREVQKYNFLQDKFNKLANNIYKEKEQNLGKYVSKLDALSPLKVLLRGYSITYKDDTVITSSNDISIGEQIKTRFADGVVISEVVSKEK